MLVFLLASCGVFQPLDGTWLFQIDPNGTAVGDCSGDDSGGGTYLGTETMWVDAYTLTGNQVAFVLSGEVLTGTLTGDKVAAEYSSGYKDNNSSSTQTLTIEATLAGGSLEGTLISAQVSKYGKNDYTCTQTLNFTADKATSSPDMYATH